jgi:hypothetical protein
MKTVQKDFSVGEGSKVDDIRTIIRQNNYSANALNLKTLNILHELNTHNYRLYSLNRTTKVAESHQKSTKAKLLSFLKKVA